MTLSEPTPSLEETIAAMSPEKRAMLEQVFRILSPIQESRVQTLLAQYHPNDPQPKVAGRVLIELFTGLAQQYLADKLHRPEDEAERQKLHAETEKQIREYLERMGVTDADPLP